MSDITLKKLDITEVVFISIYFVEQIALVLLYLLKKDLINIWVSIFPIVLLSTMAIEKVLLKAEFQEKIEGLEERTNEKKQEEKLKEFNIVYQKYLKKK